MLQIKIKGRVLGKISGNKKTTKLSWVTKSGIKNFALNSGATSKAKQTPWSQSTNKYQIKIQFFWK
jgi:hypothetical protein